ncbi:MAG: multiple sugar transport system permease protein [Candidatus Atribacteria bacterium]|nr:multiple sugar transport system permease protein [Candidatus Atribacteria bacterium]
MRKNRRAKYFFIFPAIIWVLAFTIFPLIYSLGLSFFRVRLGRPAQFVGLNNFARIFSDYKVGNSLKVTLLYVAITVSIQLILGTLIALLFNQEMRGKNIFRALLILPIFCTPVAVGYLGLTIFYEEGGPINSILMSLFNLKIPWLSSRIWAWVAVLLLDIWQWTPFCFLVILAGLQSLPEEIYDAAYIDSSSEWEIFRKITFPMIQPVIMVVLLLRLIESFKIFDVVYSLTGGGPGTATEVYSLYTYRTGMKFFDLGYASALGYLLLAIVIVIINLLFRQIREVYE